MTGPKTGGRSRDTQYHKDRAREWVAILRRTHRSKGVDFPKTHLSVNSAKCFIFSQYSMTAPIVSSRAKTTAAVWSAVRLFHNSVIPNGNNERDDDRKARLMATIKIWLIIMAIPLVIFAAFVSSAVHNSSCGSCRTSVTEPNVNDSGFQFALPL